MVCPEPKENTGYSFCIRYGRLSKSLAEFAAFAANKVKIIAEFAAFAANKVKIISGGAVYLDRNISQAASVEFVRQWRTNYARSRLLMFVGKGRKAFFDRLD